MTQRDESVCELGTDSNGIRFTLKHLSEHIDGHVSIEIDVWDGENDEAAHVSLDAADALNLAQWINSELGR